MSDTIRPIYLVSAQVEVSASGYWFTAGGEKGPFGYYPHLKKKTGNFLVPFYPDTQILGDWRMACTWLSQLSPNEFAPDRVAWLFGQEGQQKAGKVTCTDLELIDETVPTQFEVHTRCEIEDATRVNKKGMLVSREYAWLDKKTLSALILLGYFSDENDMILAKKMLEDSACLLSGFGAFRSRGYGRGAVSLKDWRVHTFLPPENPVFENSHSGQFLYALEAQTNFRNKPLNPGGTQLLVSEKKISPRQITAWLARTYNLIYGVWPKPDEMACLTVATAYPSVRTVDTVWPGYPPAFSTIRYEDGVVMDSPQKPENPNAEEDVSQTHGKAKPLTSNAFVSNTRPPGLFEIKTEQRFRNAIDASFSTEKTRGLFTQELISSGTYFAGHVTITPLFDQEVFAARAKWILENIPPFISGTFFSCGLLPGDPPSDASGIHLLVEPRHFSKDVIDDFVQYRIGIIRSYNTMIRRPRQNRIVFDPGSLMNKPVDGKTIPWKGYQQIFITYCKPPENPWIDETSNRSHPPANEDIKKMSRSQMGNLRVLTEMDLPLIVEHTKKILQKYADWNMDQIPDNLIPKKILGDIRDIAGKGDRIALIDYVTSLRQSYARFQWHTQQGNYIQDSVALEKG